MQGNWTVCAPLNHLILDLSMISKKPNVLNLPFKFCPPPRSSLGGQTNFSPPALDFFFVYALNHYMCLSVTNPFFLLVFFCETIVSILKFHTGVSSERKIQKISIVFCKFFRKISHFLRK